jgi:hypothetical protein
MTVTGALSSFRKRAEMSPHNVRSLSGLPRETRQD